MAEMAVAQPSYPKWLRYSQLSHEGPPRGVRYGCSSASPAVPTQDGCPVCIAAIGLEALAALQLAQPSLGKMAVKEPAQPFWCHIPRLAGCDPGGGEARSARLKPREAWEYLAPEVVEDTIPA